MSGESEARVLPDEGHGPEYEKQLDDALDRLEALPVVKDAKIQPEQTRVIVNTWFQRHAWSSGLCTQQPQRLANKAAPHVYGRQGYRQCARIHQRLVGDEAALQRETR